MRTPRKTTGRADGSANPNRKPVARPKTSAYIEPQALWDDDDQHGPEKLQKVAGLQAVSALFRRSPERVIRLYYGEEMKKAAGPFCSELAKLHRPYRLLEEQDLEKVAGTPLHGGIVAAVTPREVLPIEFHELSLWAKSHKPLIILDGIGNPNNLGAIARTMAFFGLEHLLISDHPEQSGLSDSAYRVAEGGLEYLKIARIPNLPVALRSLRQYYRVIGTSLSRTASGLETLAADRRRPTALVLGNEQTGLSKTTLASCEAVITIAGSGHIQSLNVAATAAILMHQLVAASTNKPSTTSRKPARTLSGAPKPPSKPRPRKQNH
jgi:TrmH RNA methyltransferase